ncbi:hypothetical protein BGX31_002442 [Mortierella sp. GBA43]|nr:hypothetical protein BGX31_002442 [Mortierella sp. GBA43]
MANDCSKIPIIMTLPPEILSKIGLFVDRRTLPQACLVSKAWLACLRPMLWRTISVDSSISPRLLRLFSTYCGHVRHVFLELPSPFLPGMLGVTLGPEHADSDLFRPREKPSDPDQPYKTLQDCRNLLSLKIKNDYGMIRVLSDDPGAGLVSTLEKAITDLIAINKSTLRELSVAGAASDSEQRIYTLILEMPRLESLALEDWKLLSTSGNLLHILKSCSHSLKKLSLEMNDVSLPFWELREWRLKSDLAPPPLSSPSSSSPSSSSSSQSVSPERSSTRPQDKLGLTKITTLVLDRCTISMRGLLDLAAVMPDLQELSLRDMSGIGEDEFEGDEEDEDDEDDEDPFADHPDTPNNEQGNQHGLTIDATISGTIMAQLDQIFGLQGENYQEQGDHAPPAVNLNSDTEHDSLPDLEEQDSLVQEDDDDMPALEDNDTPSAPTPFDLDDLEDDEDDEWLDQDDDDDDDAGIYDIEDPFAPHPAGLYDGDNHTFHWHSHFPTFPTFPLYVRSHRLFGKMRQLQRFCPMIRSFDFSACRSDGLDDAFFVFICELWGPHGTTHGNITGNNDSSSRGGLTPSSLGLKALVIQDACAFKPDFFGKVLHNCANTLTTLDLSMNVSIRWNTRTARYDEEVKSKTYYDDILKILGTCSGLEVLHVEPYPVNALLIANRKEDWVCTKLRSLRICIEFDPLPSGSEAAEKEREIQIKICQQLGRLERLEHLQLEGGRPVTRDSNLESSYDDWALRRHLDTSGTTTRRYLALSLNNGLNELAGLSALETVDLAHLGPHSLRKEQELEWLWSHWPRLTRLDGMFDRAILKSKVSALRKELGPDYLTMPNSTDAEKALRARRELTQRRGVRLPLDLDLDSDMDVIRLREKHHRYIQVDDRVVDQLLAKDGMVTVAMLEKKGAHVVHFPEDDDKKDNTFSWYVRYTDQQRRMDSS